LRKCYSNMNLSYCKALISHLSGWISVIRH
jgi:hypothetical protein